MIFFLRNKNLRFFGQTRLLFLDCSVDIRGAQEEKKMCNNTQLILWLLRILHSSFLIYYVVKQLIHVIFKNKIKQEKKTFSKSTNYIQYSKNDPIPLCKALTMPDQSFCEGYLFPLELFFPKYNHYSRHIIENSIYYR